MEVVSKCMEVTATLKKCMIVHSYYYQPILPPERAAEEGSCSRRGKANLDNSVAFKSLRRMILRIISKEMDNDVYMSWLLAAEKD
ncbi:hypothetical protein YC2023_070052 [Brassica napus]